MLKFNSLIICGFISINICFLIIGMLVLVNGSIMLKHNNNNNNSIESISISKTNYINFNLISLLVICIGVLFLIVSMFGILGTKCSNRLFLIIYLIIVFVMFLLHGYYYGYSYFMLIKLKNNGSHLLLFNEQCNYLINLKLCCDFNESIISCHNGHVMIPNLVILFIQFCSIIFVLFLICKNRSDYERLQSNYD